MADQLGIGDLLMQHSLDPGSRLTLSPDGRWVAAVITNPQKDPLAIPRFTPPNYAQAELNLICIETGQVVTPIEASSRSWAPSWSPDGTQLAFYTDVSGMVNVHVWDRETGIERQLTDEAARGFGHVSDYPHWLDDHTICLAMLPLVDAFSGHRPPLTTTTIHRGEVTAEELYWGARSQQVQDPQSPADNTFDPYYRARSDISLVSVESGTVHRVASRIRAKYPYPSPRGDRIAFTTFGNRLSPDVYAWTEDIYVVERDGQTPPVKIASGLLTGGRGRHSPAWSPSGGELAFLQDDALHIWSAETGEERTIGLRQTQKQVNEGFLLWSSDGEGFLVLHGQELLYVSRAGQRTPLSVPPAVSIRGVIRRAGESWFWSQSPGDCVVWTVDKKTLHHGFYRVPLNGGSPKQLMLEPKAFRAASFASIGGEMMDISHDERTLVFGSESANHPLRVQLADRTMQLRHDNISGQAARHLAVKETMLHWQTHDAHHHRSGILLEPTADSDCPLPLVVNLYPKIRHSAYAHTWELGSAAAILPPQWLVKHGFSVLIPDLFPGPGDFIEELYKEFVQALGALSGYPSIDLSKVAVMGHSFGGYAVNCLITRATQIKAAVSAGGCGDLTRMWATFESHQGSVDGYGCQWVEANSVGPELQAPPWVNPQAYITNSPVFQLDKVTAPLLLIGGANDVLYQPEGMLLGLSRLEKTVRCFRYCGEGHTPREWRLANRKHVAQLVADWFTEHLAG